MENGIISTFNRHRGYGFIISHNGGPSLYFNLKQFSGNPDNLPPVVGDPVVFSRRHGKPDPGKSPTAREWDFSPYISFGAVCHGRLENTTQYGAYYVGGLLETPDLSEGLRFEGTAANYHSLKIHRDDVPRFVERVKKWERALLADQTVFLCMSESRYFCTNNTDQESVPKGFTLTPIQLPVKIMRQEHLADGIIATPAQLLYYLGYVVVGAGLRKWVPNPNPAHEPEYSGFYKKSE